MTRLKYNSIWENIICPYCGSKKTVVYVGKVSAYFRLACFSCKYRVELNPKPQQGMILEEIGNEIIV